jgi:hypothetical protein
MRSLAIGSGARRHDLSVGPRSAVAPLAERTRQSSLVIWEALADAVGRRTPRLVRLSDGRTFALVLSCRSWLRSLCLVNASRSSSAATATMAEKQTRAECPSAAPARSPISAHGSDLPSTAALRRLQGHLGIAGEEAPVDVGEGYRLTPYPR